MYMFKSFVYLPALSFTLVEEGGREDYSSSFLSNPGVSFSQGALLLFPCSIMRTCDLAGPSVISLGWTDSLAELMRI
jgi:hypothetical protein